MPEILVIVFIIFTAISSLIISSNEKDLLYYPL